MKFGIVFLKMFNIMIKSQPVLQNEKRRKYYKYSYRKTFLMPNSTTGFTLIEMLVVLAIMGILMTVVLFNQSKFSNDISVVNEAQAISLDIRQAQIYGSGVRGGVGGATGDFTKPYGIHFDLNPANLTSYKFFIDNDPTNSVYNNPPDTLISTPAIGRGNKISSICAIIGNLSTQVCGPFTSLDITFIRPNPDAILTFNISPSITNPGSPFFGAVVKLLSPQGKTASITIYLTGQISVN